VSSSPNPNRQRLMSPLDYLGSLAGYKPPEEQPMMPSVPFWPGQMPPPMPFAEPVPSQPYQPPHIPMEILLARRQMGM
jgi:hypothetical protein